MERAGVLSLNPRALVLAALVAVVAFAIGALLVLFVPLGGSSLPAPAEALAISARRFQGETESIEGGFRSETKLGRLDMRAEGDFAFIAPDRMLIRIDSEGTKMEILLADGESYLRPPAGGDWYRLEDDWEGLDPDTLKLFLEARGFLDYGNLADRLVRLERLPDEQLDGETYLHYWGFLEFRDLGDVFFTGLTGQDITPTNPDLEGEPAETHLWLDRDTFLPYRVEIREEWTLHEVTSSQTITFEFKGYDADVVVPEPPADARPLVQSLRPGSILGLRCSSGARFLRERYGLPEGQGCVVLRVDSPGAAEEAGFRLGDKVVEMDGMPITSGRQFTLLFEDLPGSDYHPFVVQRGDRELTLEVRLADRAGDPKEDPYRYYLRAKEFGADTLDLDADFDQIMADYTRAIEQDPEFELPYLYRGDLQIGRDDEAARADLEYALSLDPALAEAHRLLSQLDEREYDFDAAIEHINRSIELNGCGEALERWDLDCAEDFTYRTAFYASHLGEGDDVLAERDLDAIEGVVLFEPMALWGRLQLAFVRGDDPTVRELGEQFIDMPLTRISDYLSFQQAKVEEGIFAGRRDWAAFTMPTWIVGPVEAIEYPQEKTTVTSVTTAGFHVTYNVELPSPAQGSTISGELWRGAYRFATFTLPDATGPYVQANFESLNTNLPPGFYELRVYVDGESAATLVAEKGP